MSLENKGQPVDCNRDAQSAEKQQVVKTKTYIWAKIIRAKPMDEITFGSEIRGENITLPEGCTPRAGYVVEYADGYVSWSPADVFETAYREVTDDEMRIFVPDREDPEVIKKIARVCHEVNRVYCEVIGDCIQPEWEDAPEWQQESAIAGVLFRCANQDAPICEQHAQWMRVRKSQGWTYGPVKDIEKKTHPNLKRFFDLPKEQQAKSCIFATVVNAMIR